MKNKSLIFLFKNILESKKIISPLHRLNYFTQSTNRIIMKSQVIACLSGHRSQVFLGLALFTSLLLPACKEDVKVQPPTILQPSSAFVDMKTAEIVAKNAYRSSNTFKSNAKASRVESLPQREILNSQTITTPDRQAAAYVFNYKDGGWAIISADKHFMPILAHNETGFYSATNKNNGVLFWEAELQANVQEARRTNPAYPDAVVKEWQNLVCDPDPVPERQGNATTQKCYGDNDLIYYFEVNPLLRTEWGQGCFYNSQIEHEGIFCQRSPTGCVAVAEAQVMFYYRKPINAYQWANMPVPGRFLNAENGPVAQLMKEVGNSLRMTYGTNESGAYTSDVPTSLKNKYGYASADYVDYTFDVVKANLRWAQPVILAANKDTNWFWSFDGHAWIADGFRETVYVGYSFGSLHMNWGWEGMFNGWYTSWNPDTFNFQYKKRAIINIRP